VKDSLLPMIYLDNNASTPPDPMVLETYVQAAQFFVANPSNKSHQLGVYAAEAIDEEKKRMADFFSCDPRDIFFTSGSTESIILTVYGFVLADAKKPNIIVSTVEHAAVLETSIKASSLSGGQVRKVGVRRDGQLDIEELASSLDESVALICVMAANNETGVIQNHEAITELAESFKVPVFVDLTQVVGKTRLTEAWLAAGALCLSSHKIHGLKGAGVLILKREYQKTLFNLALGGGQQRNIRGGTVNLPSIAATRHAVEIALTDFESNAKKYLDLSEAFLRIIRESGLDFEVAGAYSARLPQTIMMRFVGIDSDLLLTRLNGLAVSQASACHSGDDNPSHVLIAMGYSRRDAAEFFRVSAGRQNSTQELERAAHQLISAVKQIKGVE
jgi:cysteine desulfurase